jgi:hypothetical protein
MLSRSVVALVMTTLLVATSQVARGQQLTPCPAPNCAQVSVQGGAIPDGGGTVDIPISFTQAPNDNQANSGNDDVAAVAFTLGLGAQDSPLVLADCADDNGDGLPDAVEPAAAISNFRVVIENAFCTNRNRCLCRTDTTTQTRDNFINVVVYGPKDLPTTGPVTIPRLPNADPLLTITLGVEGNVPAPRTETLRIFAETDLTNAKPQFGAYLSIGDQGAVDQTANRGTNVSKVNVTTAQVTIPQIEGGGDCVGDCNGNGAVAVNELVIGVNIALDRAPLNTCPIFDANGSGGVEVNELVTGVNNALRGCQ